MTKLVLIRILGILCVLIQDSISLSPEEKRELMLESRDMFYHGFNAYMDNAFPADELMPLSCRGRFRGREYDRGDIDDALGNFSLTLIDSLDTLVILGDLEEFEKSVKTVIETVTFDRDISVSVFETNIRVVGGLISSHILAEMVKERFHKMSWYHGELLSMALDVGYRLLPAFNSSTGLPHPRVNLRHGIKQGKIRQVGETCTACAGTMILEFAALSRLSGEPIFEKKASAAMDVLWSARNRMSNLVGNVLNINTGDWIRRDSGVGAGIDSYYEYVAKAYVLLGLDKYLTRWETHYAAVMKYLSSDALPGLLQDVHMHRPSFFSKHFLDSLAAFWPGLQVLMGDVKPAIEAHEILHQVMVRHNFIPEAFTADFQVHWGQHFLRPEFVESTYMLYRATKDPHYLQVGKKILKAIQSHARVTCGYATIKDVRTLQKEDRMDSFVLAETFKYLYLLFAEDSDLLINMDDFVFTTEAHILPLSLARLSNITAAPFSDSKSHDDLYYDEDVELARSCPSTEYLFPEKATWQFAEEIREPLANIVADKCPAKKPLLRRRLVGSEFQPTNPDHIKLIIEMGLSVVSLPDGGLQLLHTAANARSPEDAEEGLILMQEIIDINKTQQPEIHPRIVKFFNIKTQEWISLKAGPAQFGKELEKGYKIRANGVLAVPFKGCGTIENAKDFWGKIGVVERGNCMFIEKARLLERMGAVAGIVIDNTEGSSSKTSPLFGMSGDKDNNDDVSIPLVFLYSEDAKPLVEALKNFQVDITILESEADDIAQDEEYPQDYDLTYPSKNFIERSKGYTEEYLYSHIENEILTNSQGDPSDIKEPTSDSHRKSLIRQIKFMISNTVSKYRADESFRGVILLNENDSLLEFFGSSLHQCIDFPKHFVTNLRQVPVESLIVKFRMLWELHGPKRAVTECLALISEGIVIEEEEKENHKKILKAKSCTYGTVEAKVLYEIFQTCLQNFLNKPPEELVQIYVDIFHFRWYLRSIDNFIALSELFK